MTWLYLTSAALVGALFVYLLVALFWPEKF